MGVVDPGLVLIGLLLVLLVIGLPVALALAVAGGAYVLVTFEAMTITPALLFSGVEGYLTLAIPFFIVAAELLSRGGAIGRLVEAVDALIGHWPGGLPLVAVVSTVIFSAISGSSLATAAAIGVAVIPELERRGYPRRLSLGLVTAAGGLGILIPPSIPMIVYGLVTGTSIGRLFEAGLVPGLMLAGLISIYVVYATRTHGGSRRAPASWGERGRAIARALPILSLPILILGSIYGGLLVPTEAAGLAVVCSLLITAPHFRRLGFGAFGEALVNSCATSAAILFVIAGASVFGYALTDAGAPQRVAAVVLGLDLSPVQFLIAINVLLILLGMMLEVISVILITVPILFPIVRALEIDPVHFAVVLVVNMEIAVITPPIGLNLFVISTVARTSIAEVFRSVVPFLCIIVLALIVITYVPAVSLFLPTFLRG